MKLIFEKSVPGRRGVQAGPGDVRAVNIQSTLLRESAAELPELSELDVVRHFTELSHRNFGVDSNFYPLGSCTMKLNATSEMLPVSWPEFGRMHPFAPADQTAG